MAKLKKGSKKVSSKIPRELIKLDQALFRIARREEILSKLAWPEDAAKTFLAGWEKNNPTLPKIVHPKYDFTSQKQSLQEIAASAANIGGPLANMVRGTSRSLHDAFSMLEVMGKKRFLEYSSQLYGSPAKGDPLGSLTLRAAKRLLKVCRHFRKAKVIPESDICLMPEHVREKIQKAAQKKFRNREVQVVVDPKLHSKAIAGIDRIRIRGRTCFAKHDIRQLIEHELYVHTLTLINGREQPLKSLGVSSPRTACAQEGLAVFSEFITNSMDIARLTRVSARVQAIHMAIEGADFIDVFKFFLQHGQDEQESFYSAVRIFRGGRVSGGVVFTKDLIYLKGLIVVHRFLLDAMHREKFFYPMMFFAGRFAPEDIEELEPYFESGVLLMPVHRPEWVANRSTLLAYLVSASVMTGLGLDRVS